MAGSWPAARLAAFYVNTGIRGRRACAK